MQPAAVGRVTKIGLAASREMLLTWTRGSKERRVCVGKPGIGARTNFLRRIRRFQSHSPSHASRNVFTSNGNSWL